MVIVLCGMLCAFLVFMGIQLQSRGFVIHVPFRKEPIVAFQGSIGQKIFLVMGVDAPNTEDRRRDENAFEGTRTDTMMLVRVDSHKNKVSVVSIPRDSKVYLAGGHGIDKINAAHALGGPDLAVQTVQDSFGIPVDNYVVVNFRGVRELVDAIGGIDLYIEKPMHYTDRTAGLFIDFQPGQQRLDGKQAEAFLRFRHDQLGDIGRIRRQQQFIVAVTKKLRDPMIITRIPKLATLAGNYIQSDLSPDQLMALAFFGKDVQMNDIRTATLPGHPGGVRVSYWVIDPEPAQVVLDRLVLDNPEPLPGLADDVEPGTLPTLGLFYDPALGEQLTELVSAIERKNFKVVCKQRQRRAGTQIIEHTYRATDELTNSLRAADARFAKARLIFAPVGTTFENNACSSGEDYTLILGADIYKG